MKAHLSSPSASFFFGNRPALRVPVSRISLLSTGLNAQTTERYEATTTTTHDTHNHTLCSNGPGRPYLDAPVPALPSTPPHATYFYCLNLSFVWLFIYFGFPSFYFDDFSLKTSRPLFFFPSSQFRVTRLVVSFQNVFARWVALIS